MTTHLVDSFVRHTESGTSVPKNLEYAMNLSRKKPVSEIPVVAARSSEPEPILTLEQVAERFQMKPSTVRELIRKRNRNPLPALNGGKFLRFKWSMVERWLDDSRGRAA